MGILYQKGQFHLYTNQTSYLLSNFENRFLTHLYWGKRLPPAADLSHIPTDDIFSRASAFCVPMDKENRAFLCDLPLEFSTVGTGDYRTPCYHAEYENGSTVSEFHYVGYRIYKGKDKLPGLPATYAEETDAVETLEVTLADDLTGLHAVLSYSVFEDYDIITRSIRYENHGAQKIALLSAQSVCVDLPGNEYRLLHLHGEWARERNMEIRPVGHGISCIDSKRGASSHTENPFIALLAKNADESSGDVYGFSLVYSGSFAAVAEGTPHGSVRAVMGVNPFHFRWILAEGETYQAPEVVLSYSPEGINGMSQGFHRIYRERLYKGKWRDIPRPMVINHWEGTGQNFTEDQLLKIARTGADTGLELFVVDDGWFGKRDDDTSSLGDWTVYERKLSHGLSYLADSVKNMGMMFGLWVEPEMVSPDSDLYRAHPNWCIHAEGRERTLNRNQLVLDLSRKEICDYLIGVFTDILQSADIGYIKWDCNRHLNETSSQMQHHQYILGLYYILGALRERFPDVLFEGCSGGGGRFDPGLLCYMPQTWTSDNTTPVSRLKIQHGTSVVYPPVSMSAHIGAIPVGKNERNEYMDFCAHVSMTGNFGYEMDMSLLSEAERTQVKEQIEFYKEIRTTVQFGAFYRLESPFEGDFTSWQFSDEKQTILFYYQTKSTMNGERRIIRLQGLEENAQYVCDGKACYGAELMFVGITVLLDSKEYHSGVKIFQRKKQTNILCKELIVHDF